MHISRSFLLAALAAACTVEDDDGEGRVKGYVYCAGDADCPSGEVCETDDTRDAYCTPSCSEDDECPTQVGCPSLSPVGKHCYVEPGFEGIDRGECDQFQGYYGPNSCRAAPEADDDGGGGPECTSDSQCSSQCSDCYGCRSGSCTCGYRGVSGACIF